MKRNAIIMAAGTASRFAPLSYEKPKGLLCVKGEILIERQIRQLKEVGVSDIIIVVGYMAEKFAYLKDLLGVKIVQNEEYNRYNNTSSIMSVIDELDNTFICSSDNYFPNNVFSENPNESYYSALYSSGETGEYCLITDESDNIIDVKIGGKNTWYMIGHVFFSRDFSLKFKKIMKEEYKCEQTRHEYWEDIYIRHIKELPPMKMHKYQPHDIEEFDSLEELRQFDKTYIYNTGCQMFRNICQVLRCEEKDIYEINVLKKGMTNCSFAFTCKKDDKKYVYRHPGAGTKDLINRENEYFSLHVAKDNHLDETFIAMDPAKGWKISHYIEDVETLNSRTIQQIDNFKKIANLYHTLHHSDVKLKQDFNIFREIKKYDELIDQANTTMYDGWELVKEEIASIEKKLEKMNIEPRPCHNDAVPENFIKTADGKIYLIDWEYSGMNDPIADIAALFLESSFTNDNQNTFLYFYFKGNIPSDTKIRILYYQILWDCLWAQWTVIKEAKGDYFGTYGKDRFSRAISNLDIINHNCYGTRN